MGDLLLDYYYWIQALHIVAVMSWMAGLLYLPRLFVYHAEAAHGGESCAMLQVMERRLLRIIMNPAMILAWVFGLLMLKAQPTLMQDGWMHVKLTAVFLMTFAHMAMARWRKDFISGENSRSAKFYRISNEVPTVLMILIVFMAILKPF